MKKVGTLLSIVMMICIGLLVVVGIKGKKDYDTQIAKLEEEKGEMQGRLDAIGNMVTVYKLNKDVKASTEIMSTDFDTMEVPETMAEGCVRDIQVVEGNRYILSLKQGQILMDNMWKDYKMSDDLRYKDLVVDEMPIGLEPGDWVDVRIAYPDGEDFIVLDKNRVEAINGNTVKLIVRGNDFHYIESAYSDKSLYKATKIYLTQYVEAGLQTTSQRYYPVNLEGLKALAIDPNTGIKDYRDMLNNREKLEIRLLNNEKVEKASNFTEGRTDIASKFTEATKA